MCGKELVKEPQPPISHQPKSMEEALLEFGRGVPMAKSEICTR